MHTPPDRHNLKKSLPEHVLHWWCKKTSVNRGLAEVYGLIVALAAHASRHARVLLTRADSQLLVAGTWGCHWPCAQAHNQFRTTSNQGFERGRKRRTCRLTSPSAAAFTARA